MVRIPAGFGKGVRDPSAAFTAKIVFDTARLRLYPPRKVDGRPFSRLKGERMNKGDLVERVLADKDAKIGSKAQAERIVNAVIGSIVIGLKKDRKVSVVGFGTFTVKNRPKRTVINPRTKEKMIAKPSKTVRFKAGKSLKHEL